MKNSLVRYAVLFCILLVGAIVTNALSYPRFQTAKPSSSVVEQIPSEFGGWSARDIPLEKRNYEILETSSIIHRIYLDQNGKEVFLSIVYYSDTKIDFHLPESCLGGRGVHIDKSTKAVSILYGGKPVYVDVNQLIVRENDRDELVYYFYKAGSFVGRSYFGLRFCLALNKFLSAQKSGALIRLSTSVQHGRLDSSREVLERFLADLYPIMLRAL